jgi:hypothetical protein
MMIFAKPIIFSHAESFRGERMSFAKTVSFGHAVKFSIVCNASPPDNRHLTQRAKLTKRFHALISRVLDFARHETLRKLHRHFQSSASPAPARTSSLVTPHSSLVNAEGDLPESSSLTFDLGEFTRDLDAATRDAILATIATAGQEVWHGLGRDDPWTMPAQATLDFLRTRENLLSDVPDEIHRAIMDAISEGISAGDTLDQITARVSDAFDAIDEGRAALIADNETSTAYAFSSDESAKAAGVKYKRWIHSDLSLKPRPDHIAMNGLVVPIDQPFPVGDPPLMYPHDPNGSPGDTINCGCISVPVADAEGEQ